MPAFPSLSAISWLSKPKTTQVEDVEWWLRNHALPTTMEWAPMQRISSFIQVQFSRILTFERFLSLSSFPFKQNQVNTFQYLLSLSSFPYKARLPWAFAVTTRDTISLSFSWKAMWISGLLHYGNYPEAGYRKNRKRKTLLTWPSWLQLFLNAGQILWAILKGLEFAYKMLLAIVLFW